MGIPRQHIPVKLITGIITNRIDLLQDVRGYLEKKFGEVEFESQIFDFCLTDYYEEELGKSLKRKFFSFKNLVIPDKSYKIKLYTNKLEIYFSDGKNRTVNIDPGYITLSKLVLFTTKDRSHRIYIDRGIYGDLELQYVRNGFRPYPWTYPDYKTNDYINFFNLVRKKLLEQLRKLNVI